MTIGNLLRIYLDTFGLAPELIGNQRRLLADALGPITSTKIYPASITAVNHSLLFLGNRLGKKYLGVISSISGLVDQLEEPEHEAVLEGVKLRIRMGAATSRHAAWLRKTLPFLQPKVIGSKKSAGCGDRLGLATPGHVRAIRKAGIAPIFAQQSVRENERTGRTPQEVVDDAMWGAFQEGWRLGFGADADHLKTIAQADAFVAAGYTFYTIDPGEYVDNDAEKASSHDLEQKLAALPWGEMESTPSDLEQTLAERPVDLEKFGVRFSREEVMRAAAKYGRALSHTVLLYRYLLGAMNGRPFELEMSVDETESPTTLAEHVYIASELRRLGVQVASLAPRYVGVFEKGVDYIGDLALFERAFSQHVGVARTYGPYKLSIHSGSDKFKIYPIASRLAGDLIHLKTAGTSYLEALRTIARCDPGLFKDIVGYAIGRYPSDRATYHVSADPSLIPDVGKLAQDDLPGLLENFHAREVLHVTYGSVLNEKRLRAPFLETLEEHEEQYARVVEAHFDRHFSLFN
jgi:tagaturonate epimerase